MAMILGTRSVLSKFTVGICCYKGRADFPPENVRMTSCDHTGGTGPAEPVYEWSVNSGLIHGVETSLDSPLHCSRAQGGHSELQ